MELHDDRSLLAIQGPAAAEVLQVCCAVPCRVVLGSGVFVFGEGGGGSGCNRARFGREGNPVGLQDILVSSVERTTQTLPGLPAPLRDWTSFVD
jgi:hypothetical protein